MVIKSLLTFVDPLQAGNKISILERTCSVGYRKAKTIFGL